MKYHILINNLYLIGWDSEKLNNITFGTFADSNDSICVFAGFAEFVCIYIPVDQMVVLWVSQKYQIVDRYDTFYLTFMDIQG